MSLIVPTIGLCEKCIHAETVSNLKGSTFTLCTLSKTNPAFPKYPRLPVVTCEGFLRNTERQTEQSH
jgi:hypothetical protein